MNLTEFRRSYIKLDKASQSYITPQYVKQGDYNGRELIVQITDGGAVKDMTGVSLELGWKHESIQNAGLEPFAELDVSQGLFKVAYPTELLNPGRVLCAIRVSENGTVTNSMNFTVTVEANPFDDTTLVSDNAFTLLEQLIQDSDATKIYEVNDRLTNQINETDTRLTSQLAETAIQLSTQIDVVRTEQINPSRINENSISSSKLKIAADGDRLKLANMSDEVLQAIAGNASINVTPADLSTTTEKVADGAVTPQKTSFLNQSANLFNRHTATPKSTIDLLGNVTATTQDWNVSDYIAVEPGETYRRTFDTTIVIFDENKSRIIGYAGDGGRQTITMPADARFVRFMVFASNIATSTYMFVKGATLPASFVPFQFTLKPSNSDFPVVVNGQDLPDNTVTHVKRTRLGEVVDVSISSTGTIPNLRTGTKVLEFPTGFSIINGKTRYNIPAIQISYAGTEPNPAIFYNTKTNAFLVVKQSDLSLVTEDHLLIATFLIRATDGVVVNVNIGCRYTVNSTASTIHYLNLLPYASKTYHFAVGDIPLISDSDLPGVGDVGSPFNYTDDDHVLVYGLFDAFVSAYPDYVSKAQIGTGTGDIPIYRYDFKPSRPSGPDPYAPTAKPLPKLLLTCGIHGDENTAVYALYHFFDRVCNEWQTDAGLEYMRHNVTFSVIPLENPYGFDNKTYGNANGVNVNRNYDYDWSNGAEPKGVSAFSEPEAVATQNFLNANKDAVHLVNMHSRGERQVVDSDKLMWIPTNTVKGQYASMTTITDMTRKWRQKYTLPNIPFYGYTNVSVVAGTQRSYAELVTGIMATTWETFPQSADLAVDSKEVIDMSTDYLGHYLVNLLRYYKDLYYAKGWD